MISIERISWKRNFFVITSFFLFSLLFQNHFLFNIFVILYFLLYEKVYLSLFLNHDLQMTFK